MGCQRATVRVTGDKHSLDLRARTWKIWGAISAAGVASWCAKCLRLETGGGRGSRARAAGAARFPRKRVFVYLAGVTSALGFGRGPRANSLLNPVRALPNSFSERSDSLLILWSDSL
jgi:hypothetical protein